MKIALFGDSFGVQKMEEEFDSWVTMLNKHIDIDNFCKSGIGEYKILKQIQQTDLSVYDKVLITHTSPNRVYVKFNPLHQDSQYHKDCDIIYSDIENNSDKFSIAGQLYFKHIFDFEYAKDIHIMICKEIEKLINHKISMHITHFDYNELYNFPDMINFYPLFLKNRGTVNHYNKKGNITVFQTLLDKLIK